MKIGINARALQNIHGGIANYLLNLILNLKKVDTRNKYVLFFGSEKVLPEGISNLNFVCDISKIPTTNKLLKLAWAHLYLPHAIERDNIDIFHESSFIVPPLLKKCDTVITVYDLAFLYVPFGYTWHTNLYFKSLMGRSLRQANAIIAISKSAKNDILNNFPVSPNKIHVVYGGVDETFKPVEDTNEIMRVKKKYGITQNFFLAVSFISPRKNLVKLINAFRLLKERGKIDCKLAVVGGKGWLYEEVFKEVAVSGLENDVVFYGYIPKEDLICLYSIAEALVYPSLYEGFGLPILEAMACGCPVIASNISSIPEACGEAALLIDPYDVDELSHQIYTIINNRSLRGDLIKKGLEQAKKFSWEKAAKQTLDVYSNIKK